MGHREQLLAGAKRCLYERGYARTTARDIVAASGTNLASIGYHFGSKEALLNAAMIEVLSEWGDEFARAVAVDPEAPPLRRLEALWAGVIESVAANRPLWANSLDVLLQTEHSPELRDQLAGRYEEGRIGFAAMLRNDSGAPAAGADSASRPETGTSAAAAPSVADPASGRGPAADPDGAEVARAIGSLVMATINGLVIQLLLDPARAPSAHDLATALRALVASAVAEQGADA